MSTADDDAPIGVGAFAGPEVLVDRLLQARSADRPASLPRAGLLCLVSSAYAASLTREEGRSPRLVIYVPCKGGSAPAPHLRFDPPVVLNVQALRRLSPSVPPRPYALYVRLTDSTAVAEGLMRAETAKLELGSQMEYSAGWYPVGLYLCIDGPGALTLVDLGGQKRTLQLRDGELREPVDLTQCPVFTHALAEVSVAASNPPLNPTPDEQNVLQRLLRDTWARVIGRTVELAHGGTFILPTAPAPPAETPPFYAYCAEHVPRARYACDGQSLVNAIWELLRTPSHTDEALKRRHEAARRVDDLVSMIAHLSASDGCVVLDQLLRPRCFGGEICTADAGRCVQLADQGPFKELREVNLNSLGMRHRSAARLCAHAPAYAFVVSQDGDIRAFVHRGPGVVGMCGPMSLFLAHSPRP